MSDYNREKGRVQFWETIAQSVAPTEASYTVPIAKGLSKGKSPADAAVALADLWKMAALLGSTLTGDQTERLKDLAASFEGSAGVMPIADDGVFAAKRLAAAIIAAAKEPVIADGIDQGAARVLELMGVTQQAPEAVRRSTELLEVEEAEDGSLVLKGNWGHTQEAKSDAAGDTIRSQNVSDEERDIDLLEDVQRSELSAEGQRKTGILSANFNALTDTAPILEDELQIMGKIWFTDNGEIERVECPWCDQSDVYIIGMGHYGCFICDKEFDVPLEMGDMQSGE